MLHCNTVTYTKRRHKMPTASRRKSSRGEAPSLVEAAYQEIKRRILSNEYPPNYQCVESRLVLALGMSRTPVHEALVRLQQEGLVEIVSRHGMRVLPIAPADMVEIYQVLTAVEAAAAELLALRGLPPAEFDALDSIVGEMDDALRREDLAAWADADERFHRRLLELCGNRRLQQVGFALREQVNRARLVTLALRPKPLRSNQAHRELVRLARLGMADEARELHRAQRVHGSRELTEILKRYPLGQL
jgi:DNA-binding GntR family transcriptional regulator